MDNKQKHSYEIQPRSPDLGGWQLRLLRNGKEVGGGVILDYEDAMQEAQHWLARNDDGPGKRVCSIAPRWEEFKGKLVAAGAGAIQVDEMRRAFYAGVAEMIRIDKEICCDPDMSAQEATTILNGVIFEVNEYQEQLEQEKADHDKSEDQ